MEKTGVNASEDKGLAVAEGLYARLVGEPQRPFATLGTQRVSYGDLRLATDRFGGLFERIGASAGERAVICSADERLVIEAFVANLLHGVTSVVVPHDVPPARLAMILAASEPALALIDESVRAGVELPAGVHDFTVRSPSGKGSALLKRFSKKAAADDWRSTLAAEAERPPAGLPDPSVNAALNFTSGSTGSPKGVQVTRAALFGHLATFMDVFGYGPDSRLLNNLALGHADGLLQGPALALACGGQLVRPCGMDVQELETLLDAVHAERITHWVTVPTILSFVDRFAAADDYFSGDHFRHLVSVAGGLDPALWERLETRFGVRISNVYGLTETVLGGLFCGPDDDNWRRGTIGRPIDVETRIVDPEDPSLDVAVGEPGELLLRGPAVFPGYWRAPELDAAAFADGWFRSGDRVRVDADGFFVVEGRLKDIIVTGGFNVNPAEVDEVLLAHPGVAEVATVGLPDPQWQEIAVSAVVPDGAAPSEAELLAFCRERLEPNKVPKRIALVESLPRGEAGKVRRPALIETLSNRSRAASVAAPASGTSLDETTLIRLAAETFRVDASTLDLRSAPGATTGWDSLGHLSLVLAVEEATGRKLAAGEIVSIRKLGDVLTLLEG